MAASLSKEKILFLLYVSVMLIITFLQQEFVLLPELQSIDIIGEDVKAELLERYQKVRWFSFLLVPIVLILRLSLVTMCLFIGGFFFPPMSGKTFKDWWGVATIAQAIMLFYSIVLCIVNLTLGSNEAMTITTYTSLLFFGGPEVEQWVKVPLSAINVFEIIYWMLLSMAVGRLCKTKFGESFRFVLSSYGVGYLFYIAFLMFLLLFLM